MLARANLVRLVLIIILVAGLGLALVNHWLDPAAMQVQLREHHDTAMVLFLAYHVLASLFFVPRSLLAIAAGAIFGLWTGLGLALLGANLGALVGFWTARLLNGGLIDPALVPRVGIWLARAQESGFRTAFLIRLSPLPNSLVNYALGLSRISTLPYLGGTMLGMIPAAFIAVNIGASGADALSGQTNLMAMVSWGGAFVALTGFTAWMAPYLSRQADPVADQTDPAVD
jgi:uncharacterized membrane protein YdjX (TVP38/TMEM64 family)